jgi:hypothetical protein
MIKLALVNVDAESSTNSISSFTAIAVDVHPDAAALAL